MNNNVNKKQEKENNSGLPDNLKAGIENLSGYSMDDVKVHYNSSKPDQLQAHAYAQGTDIHVAPDQEKQLPHEAWHVVQQKQGRVKPTLQMKGGLSVDDDAQLEKEADIMGQHSINKAAKNIKNSQNLSMLTTPIPNILLETKTLIFDSCGLELTNPVLEKESKDYGAYQFELNALKILFRVAKTTPTKVGQFVTLWKRLAKGPIQPFDFSDNIDLFIINTRIGDNFGQFVFPKSVLSQQEILTTNLKEGKRAIRVYPPWDTTTNKQAQKTQKWQLDYFLEIPLDKPIDSERAKFLYLQEIK